MRKLIPALGAVLLAAAAPPATDWATTVAKSADGAFVIGNPKAAKSLVEYASYTCGHCAHFAVESSPELEQQIAAGKVRLEYRHAVRDAVDLTAALLVRCAGPAKFLAASKAVYASQADWMGKAQSYVGANQQALKAAKPDAARVMVAKGSGLMGVVAPFGVTEAKGAACLANTAEQNVLIAQANDAWGTRKIPGTPHFVINGQSAEANTWPEIRAQLAKP